MKPYNIKSGRNNIFLIHEFYLGYKINSPADHEKFNS